MSSSSVIQRDVQSLHRTLSDLIQDPDSAPTLAQIRSLCASIASSCTQSTCGAVVALPVVRVVKAVVCLSSAPFTKHETICALHESALHVLEGLLITCGQDLVPFWPQINATLELSFANSIVDNSLHSKRVHFLRQYLSVCGLRSNLSLEALNTIMSSLWTTANDTEQQLASEESIGVLRILYTHFAPIIPLELWTRAVDTCVRSLMSIYRGRVTTNASLRLQWWRLTAQLVRERHQCFEVHSLTALCEWTTRAEDSAKIKEFCRKTVLNALLAPPVVREERVVDNAVEEEEEDDITTEEEPPPKKSRDSKDSTVEDILKDFFE